MLGPPAESKRARFPGAGESDAAAVGRSQDLARVEFCLSPGSTIEVLPDSALLFSERDQQIHALNPSSAVLASRLEAGATVGELADELIRRGVDPATALEWVNAFLAETAHLGVLAARPADREAPAAVTQRLSAAGSGLELHYASSDLFRLIGSAYAHLESDGADLRFSYVLALAGPFVLIGKDDAPALVAERPLAAVQLKGLILNEVVAAAGDVAALHAACLARGKGAMLLLGSPGAGKTTLALALIAQGFRYGSDDVTLVGRDGSAAGVPLAPGVKESAWNVAEGLGWDLSGAPEHFRPDGQKVRFASVGAEALSQPGPVATIVRLCRSPGVQAALEPLAPSEALAELLREGRSRDGKCTPEILGSLAKLVSGADCFDLRYTDSSDAVPLLRGLPAHA